MIRIFIQYNFIFLIFKVINFKRNLGPNLLDSNYTNLLMNKPMQKAFAFYLLFTFITSLLLNSVLILIFIRYKKSRTPLNRIIIMTTALNLFGTFQFPLEIYSNLTHR
jgi:hypothetical protein